MLNRYVLVVTLVSVLASCGGGGDGGDSSPTASVTLSGVVTYTHYKAGKNGLEYGNPTEKPIRGAVVELRDASGVVLKSGNTSETGTYSFTAPTNEELRVLVKAALGSPNAPHVKVVDNTNSSILYAMPIDVTTGTVNLAKSINANSGWDGTGYTGVRSAAPFAILDTIYQAEKLILGADSAVVFPDLTVNWSTKNKPSPPAPDPGNNLLGEIGTSHYIASNLYILGAEDLDTDEYDSSVIAHEWSHYFEDKVSRSDSIGGKHTDGNILDPRVAFGEGFGNAFSGMVFSDPLYFDTGGNSQAVRLIGMNLEIDSVPDSSVVTNGPALAIGTVLDGFYSENSIQEVVYDLFDSSASDDDTLSLGFKPIYDVMVGGQKATPALTSIFSFLHYLKAANPSFSANITALAAAENIGNGDEFEESLFPIYTIVPTDGTIVSIDVDGLGLQTWDIYGPITATESGNKFLNEMFFKFSILSTENYTIEVIPTGGGDVFFELNEKGIKTRVDGFVAGVKESLSKSLSVGTYSMAAGSFGGPVTFTVRIF